MRQHTPAAAPTETSTPAAALEGVGVGAPIMITAPPVLSRRSRP